MRVRLIRLLQIEVLVLVISLSLAWLFAPMRANFAYTAAIMVFFLAMHGAILPFRGHDFVMYDEPPDSPLKYYFFATIFLAVFFGGFLKDAVLQSLGLPLTGI